MSKRLTAEEKQYQKRQATVGLASNVLGITAGGAALATAGKNKAFKNPSVKNAGPVTSRMARSGKLKLSSAAQKRLILAGAGGAVGLQAANLGGDLVTNRVLFREVKKNDMSMISKAEGSVRLNGHGVNLSKATKADNTAMNTGLATTIAGAAPLSASVVYSRRGEAIRNNVKTLKNLENSNAKLKSKISNLMQNAQDPDIFLRAHNENVRRKDLANRISEEKSKNKKLIKITDKKMVNSLRLGRGMVAGGTALSLAGLASSSVGSKKVQKAQRRFDPEADRQRRIGMYSAGGALGAVYLGDKARGQLTREGARIIKPKGKKGALLGLSAIASGALGAGAYKRGVDVRNQPWT